jgi:ABC-type transport system involved in cytochrome c biogenesis permease subunit
MSLDKIGFFCFEASYALALILELVQLLQPRPVLRLLSMVAGGAGLLAHTLFLAVQKPPMASQVGSLLFLAWILAVFYLYGSAHHRKLAWGVFVLPVVLVLGGLAWFFQGEGDQSNAADWLNASSLWSGLHGFLLLLAGVGVSVGFVASVMYLFQAHRLKAKAAPGHGLKLMSLERLEQMNRRAINIAFPLLTAGVLVGAAQTWLQPGESVLWTNLKIVTAAALWVSFALLLFLRYGAHLRGRNVAVLTIVTFVLMLVFLTTSHAGLKGGEP